MFLWVCIYTLFWWKLLELLQCKIHFCICYVCRAVVRMKKAAEHAQNMRPPGFLPSYMTFNYFCTFSWEFSLYPASPPLCRLLLFYICHSSSNSARIFSSFTYQYVSNSCRKKKGLRILATLAWHSHYYYISVIFLSIRGERNHSSIHIASTAALMHVLKIFFISQNTFSWERGASKEAFRPWEFFKM